MCSMKTNKVNCTLVNNRPMGFELLTASYGDLVFVCPSEDDEEVFNTKATEIAEWLEPLCERVIRTPFEAREAVRNLAHNIANEVREGRFSDWDGFLERGLFLQVNEEDLPQFAKLHKPIGVVPAKWASDGLCGKTADEQSTEAAGYSFLKSYPNDLVILQHFNKVADLNKVKATAEALGGAYVPGLTENEELLGLRGVSHVNYYNLYSQLAGLVGVAGTHTWIAAALFPDMPQIIVYRRGIEDWSLIAERARAHGRQYYAVPFDETSDMKEVYAEVESLCEKIF